MSERFADISSAHHVLCREPRYNSILLLLTSNRSYYCFFRTLLLSKIEASTVDTLKVTHYETFSLRPDELDVSGSRFHDMCAFVAQ